MKFGLKDIVVEQMNQVFSSFEELEEVIIYGSRAKGNYKPNSDIDLTFKGNKLNLFILNKIGLELDDLLLPYSFDLSIYDHINNSDLVDHIQRVGEKIYKK